MELDKVYGTQAKVFIQYEGSLDELGVKLEKGLNIPALRYDNMEEDPYDLVGYTEILGFEIALKQLKNYGKWVDYQYLLEIVTTDSFQEIFGDRMFDISLWMARHIALVCEVITLAENRDKDTGQSFFMNKINSKRDSGFVVSTSAKN